MGKPTKSARDQIIIAPTVTRQRETVNETQFFCVWVLCVNVTFEDRVLTTELTVVVTMCVGRKAFLLIRRMED